MTELTAVDRFWSRHTVQFEQKKMVSLQEHETYLQWRFEAYPHFAEMMQLDGSWTGSVVLDYGCGPGADVVWFLTKCGATKVYGVDISTKALDMTRHYLSLYDIDADEDTSAVELLRKHDRSEVPLPSCCVDHVHCAGVLQHVSDPAKDLAEIWQVLRPGGTANVMVYTRPSLHYDLHVAYQLQILNGDYPGLTTAEAFAKQTDTAECPIVRCYEPETFLSLCREAGFSGEFLGGYLSQIDNASVFYALAPDALRDDLLAEEHKAFLREIDINAAGEPTYKGKLCGLAGVYRLRKPNGQES